MLIQDIRVLTVYFRNICVHAGTLNSRNRELAGEVQEQAAHVKKESAWLKAVTKGLANGKSELATNCLKCASSR